MIAVTASVVQHYFKAINYLTVNYFTLKKFTRVLNYFLRIFIPLISHLFNDHL